jgi:L-lactate dehydrogenase complex protein LldG
MSSSRDAILGRVRAAIGHQTADRVADYAAVPRHYIQRGSAGKERKLDLFAERLHDYDAVVHRCLEPDIAETVTHALVERGKRRLLIPEGLPGTWLPNAFEFIRDSGLSYTEIDGSDGVITECALAIALTGTIVLRHSPATGRRALTLIPDYHLCVVFAEQVVETVAEGFELMAQFGPVPITTISGPSATSDIEMTRIKGVHGPRVLDVILVER